MTEKVFVVIPTIRNLNFLEKWGNEFNNAYGIIIEDHNDQEIDTPKKYFKKVFHFTWKDIDRDLGNKSWIIPRKNAGIRSYGFYKAYKFGADIITSLDDDCYPEKGGWINGHIENLKFKGSKRWFATYPNPSYMYTRGFPYQVREKIPVLLSHGLWSGALDLDANVETKLPKLLNEKAYPPIRQLIPDNLYFPMCSMNMAFKRMAVPALYFPLMGKDVNGNDWGYDRYDDIWAGIFIKKIFDHLGFGIVNGSPFVNHQKKSLPNRNLEKELKGMKVNELLWQKVERVKLTGKTIAGCYKEIANKTEFPNNQYFKKLKSAMKIWASLY